MPALPSDPTFAVGYVAGVAITMLILLVFILMNLAALGHRETNRCCALAVVIALGGWLLMDIAGIIGRGISSNLPLGIGCLVVVVTAIGSIVLAIVGLIELGTRAQVRGRKRAIATLVLNCASGVLFAAIFAVAIQRSAQQAADARAKTAAAATPVVRHAPAPAFAHAESFFHSPLFGYSVHLEKTNWTRRWTNSAESNTLAEWGVTTADGSGFGCIIPIWIGDEEADPDALTHALLARIGVPFPNDEIFGLKDWKQGAARGQALAFRRAGGPSKTLFRMRVLRRGGYAYLLAADLDENTSGRPEWLDEFLDRVTFDREPPSGPDLGALNAREKLRHALVFNDLGTALEAARQNDQALPWFRRALASDRSDPTFLLNFCNLEVRLGQAKDAMAMMDERGGAFAENQKVLASRASIQILCGDTEGAVKSFRTLAGHGYRNDDELANGLHTLCEQGHADAALKILDAYGDSQESPFTRRQRAQILIYQRDFAKAIGFLEEQQKAAPKDAETRIMLADAYFAAQRFDDALGACDAVISDGRSTGYVYRRKALCEMVLKRYSEAKASLEKAGELDPGNAEVKQLLERVSGTLGQGGNSSVKNPIPPVEIPASLLAVPAAAEKNPYLSGFSAWHLLAVKAIDFEQGKERRTTEHHVIKVLDQKGVESLSTLEFRFDPLWEEIYVNTAEVRNAAGESVARADVNSSYVIDEGAEEIASQRRVLHVPIPGLQPGCTLEYTVTRREAQAAVFPFTEYTLSRGLPVLRSILLLKAPAQAVKYEASPGLEPRKLDGALVWTVDQPPTYRPEPMQAPVETFLPTVWMGDAGATWQGEARDYFAQIKGTLATAPEVRQAALEATKGLKTNSEKIAALSRMVQRELTYKAIEFGRRARIPTLPAQTLRNHYGDCKDHALLLWQMLEAAGVPAKLALVSFGTNVRKGLPSLDQFSHMIVSVPEGKHGRFIDCTVKAGSPGAPVPFGLAQQDAFVLDPEHAAIEAIPSYPAGSSSISATREISFPNEQDLSIRETVIFEGISAANLRTTLQAMQPAHRTRYLLQAMDAELPTIELKDAQIENVDDPVAPLRFKLQYAAKRKFGSVAGLLIGQLPAVWERVFLKPEAIDARQTPFRVMVPLHVESTVTVTPPEGWQIQPADEQTLGKPFCSGTSTSKVEDRRLRLHAEVTQRTGEFPAREYAAYSDQMNEALGLLEPSILCKQAQPGE